MSIEVGVNICGYIVYENECDALVPPRRLHPDQLTRLHHSKVIVGTHLFAEENKLKNRASCKRHTSEEFEEFCSRKALFAELVGSSDSLYIVALLRARKIIRNEKTDLRFIIISWTLA